MASRSECAQISKAVYGGKDESALNTDVWTHIDLNGNKTSEYIDDITTIDSGFQGGIYGKDVNHDGIYEEIVVAYRGTEFLNNFDVKDLTHNDIGMAFNIVPAQYPSALKLYKDAVAKFGADKITVTGHSLGGILTQLVCAKTGAKGVTFNSVSVKNLLPQINVNTNGNFSNITNYAIENEFLNRINISLGLNNIGNNYIIPSTNEDPITAHCNLEAFADTAAILKEQHYRRYQCTSNPLKPHNSQPFKGQLPSNKLITIYPSITKPIGYYRINNNYLGKNPVNDEKTMARTNPAAIAIINQTISKSYISQAGMLRI